MLRIKDKCKVCGKFMIPDQHREMVEASAPQSICRCDESDGVLVIKNAAKLSWSTEIILFVVLSLFLSPLGWGLIRGIMWLVHHFNSK